MSAEVAVCIENRYYKCSERYFTIVIATDIRLIYLFELTNTVEPHLTDTPQWWTYAI